MWGTKNAQLIYSILRSWNGALLVASIITGLTISYNSNFGWDLGVVISGLVSAALFFISFKAIVFTIVFGTDEGKSFRDDHENEDIKQIILRLRSRSKSLRIAARVVLLLIVATLALGIQIFSFADISAARSQSYLSIQRSARLLSEQITNNLTRDMSKVVVESLKADGVIVRGEMSDQEFTKSVEDISAAVNKQIENSVKENIIKNIQNAATELEKQRALAEQTEAQTQSLLVSALSTRIGITFLLLFLVQILVSLYRYNIRLSAFYDARADALAVAKDVKKMKFSDIVDLTAPEKLDFVRQKAPTDQAIDIAREILTRYAK